MKPASRHTGASVVLFQSRSRLSTCRIVSFHTVINKSGVSSWVHALPLSRSLLGTRPFPAHLCCSTTSLCSACTQLIDGDDGFVAFDVVSGLSAAHCGSQSRLCSYSSECRKACRNPSDPGHCEATLIPQLKGFQGYTTITLSLLTNGISKKKTVHDAFRCDFGAIFQGSSISSGFPPVVFGLPLITTTGVRNCSVMISTKRLYVNLKFKELGNHSLCLPDNMFSHVRPVRVATATFANSRACSGLFAARVAHDEFVSSCLVCENFFFGANFGLVRDFVAGGTFAIAGCAWGFPGVTSSAREVALRGESCRKFADDFGGQQDQDSSDDTMTLSRTSEGIVS